MYDTTWWQNLLGSLSGYKRKYESCSDNFQRCYNIVNGLRTDIEDRDAKLAAAEETIRHLKLLVPRPDRPELANLEVRDTDWVQKVVSKLNADIIRLPLGREFRLTDKDTFLDFIAWDWVDSYEYHKFYRCGNFAISFKAHADQWGVNQAGIVLDYASGHAYNLLVFPNGKVMLLEPQSDNIFIWQEHLPQFYNLTGAHLII